MMHKSKKCKTKLTKKPGTEIEDGGIDIPPDSDGITRLPADDDNGGNNE